MTAAPRICSRCKIAPAIHGRPGPLRCPGCAAAPVLSRNRTRPKRTGPKATNIPRKKITRAVLNREPLDDADREALEQRPRTRGECAGGARPCPWVTCKHHLYLDINPNTGSIKINFPDLEPDELTESCALDIADRGGITLEEVGRLTNLTRERIRQVEVMGLIELKFRMQKIGAE